LNFGSGFSVMTLFSINAVGCYNAEIYLISSAFIHIKSGPDFAKANYRSLRYIALHRQR
jgi:hypothetical protein